MQQKLDSGRVKACEVINIPGNPNRLFMRIVEDTFLNRYLKIQFCANAGPMGDVIDNYKLKVHPDGRGCDIEIPISPSFYLLENAMLLVRRKISDVTNNGSNERPSDVKKNEWCRKYRNQ